MSYLKYKKEFNPHYKGNVKVLISNCTSLHIGHSNLDRHEWKRLYRSLNLSERVAQQFVKIGSNEILTNPKYLDTLPSSWSAVYQLTHFIPSKLKTILAKKEVNSSTTRKDIDIMRRGVLSHLPSSKKKNSKKFLNIRIESEKGIDVEHLDDFENELNKLIKKYSNKINLYVEDNQTSKLLKNRQTELLKLFNDDLKSEKQRKSPDFDKVFRNYKDRFETFGSHFNAKVKETYNKFKKKKKM